ncbi:MAG: restriction endonuclease subunit S [Bacteroidales bacterium]
MKELEVREEISTGEWTNLPFDEAVLINPKVTLKKGETYPFVEMANIDSTTRIVQTLEKKVYNGGGSKFEDGDTLMARITPCLENGKISRYKSNLNDSDIGFGSTEFIVIRGRRGVTDNVFAYYLTTWSEFRNFSIGQMNGSSGRQRVPTSSLSEFIVRLPPLPVQKKIAAILSSLDDKIEQNTRMNKVLEEIARALFQRWFVAFEFPDAEGMPYKSAGGKMVESEMGMVPEGWDIVSFRDIITVRTEKSNDPDIPEYSVTNLGIYPRDEKYKKKLSAVTSRNKIVHQFDLVFGMSREILNWGLMKDEIGGVSLAYNVFIIDQTVNPLFLESFMKNNLPYFKDVIKPASREGQGIDKAALYSKNIYLPPQDVLDSYYKIEGRLLSMCKYHDEENARLTEIRDTLLPKLMSGELNITS